MKESIAIPFHHVLQYGFGDVVREWLRTWSWAASLRSMSRVYNIDLLVCSHNAATIDFFKYVPYVRPHRIIWEGQTPDFAGYAQSINSRFIKRDEYKEFCAQFGLKPNDIYLSQTEKRQFSRIINKPYVVIHPFAGNKKRTCIDPKKYEMLIDRLIDELGYRVVVIGGTFERGLRHKNAKAHIRKEEFEYERNGLINLVNKTSLRLPTKLVINSKWFLGNWSAYLCASWERKISTIAFLNTKPSKELPNSKIFNDRWHSKCYAVDAQANSPEVAFENAINIIKEKE